jgi:hypothetical protein
MKKKICYFIFLFLIIVILKFYLTKSIVNEEYTLMNNLDNLTASITDPMELEKFHLYDPTGWKWELIDGVKVLTNVFKINALRGQIDYIDVMATPSFGFQTNSGLEYSNINKLQGTDGWYYLNEARHGKNWFWWRPTIEWQNLPELQKRTNLEIQIIITNVDKPPEFPVSYVLKIQDFNYNRTVRFWLTLTYNPVLGMSNNSNLVSTHTIAPPLMLKQTQISLFNKVWKVNNNIAIVNIPITIQQGSVGLIGDNLDIKGLDIEKKNINKWFSWNILNENSIIIQCKINNNFTYDIPSSFPIYSLIKIKDMNMDRYVYIKLKIISNPFYNEYYKISKQPKNVCL